MGKGLLLFIAGLVAVGVLYPGEAIDVARLTPVEVLVATVEGNQVKLSGGWIVGYGDTWQKSMADFQSHGQGFLGTTAHVVAEQTLLDDVVKEPLLRPAARVYRWVMEIEEQKLIPYLKTHPGQVTIATIRRGSQVTIPTVLQEKGGLTLGET